MYVYFIRRFSYEENRICVGMRTCCYAACSTTYPFDAGATGMVGSKVGEASQSFIGSYYMGAVAGFPLKGEGGVQMAAKNGGISKIGTVDIRIDWPASPAIPFCTVTTVVSGD